MLLYPDCNFLAYLQNFGYRVVIIQLRFLYETVRAMVDRLLVRLLYWYQIVKAGLENISPTRRKCLEAIVPETAMAPGTPLLTQ